MGLDRNAAALLLAGSDERGRSAGEDAEFIAGVFGEHGATDVFSTDDPDEGEAFVAARRYAIPRWRPRARCCSRTSACRCPGSATWSAAWHVSPPSRT